MAKNVTFFWLSWLTRHNLLMHVQHECFEGRMFLASIIRACFCWHKQDMSWPRRDQINWPLQHDTLQDHPFGEAALP